jgi:hypothetical protein
MVAWAARGNDKVVTAPRLLEAGARLKCIWAGALQRAPVGRWLFAYSGRGGV